MLTSSNHQKFIAVHTSVARNLSHALKQQQELFRTQLNSQYDQERMWQDIDVTHVFREGAIVEKSKISNIDR